MMRPRGEPEEISESSQYRERTDTSERMKGTLAAADAAQGRQGHELANSGANLRERAEPQTWNEMLAYLGHKGRQMLGSNTLEVHEEGTCRAIRKRQREAGWRVGPRLVPVQVKSRRGTSAFHEVQTVDAIVMVVIVKRRR